MDGPIKIRQGGPDYYFLSHQCISQRGVRTPLEKQLDPRGPIASRDGSVQVYLRKSIATFEYQGGGGSGPPVSPLSGSAHKIGMTLDVFNLLFI